MARILLVEDDADIAAQLSSRLIREGYEIEHLATGQGAVERACAGGIDMVILDLGLPDVDGLDVCRRLRELVRGLPVLMLTARATEIDVVAGLDSGAADYVIKPFRTAELLARIRARLRSDRGGDHPEVGGVRLDVGARQAWHGDTLLLLSIKEFDLLVLLVRERGQVVTRQRIMAEVWDQNWWGSTRTLDVHMTWLRRKLADNNAHPPVITTVRGVGFRLEND